MTETSEEVEYLSYGRKTFAFGVSLIVWSFLIGVTIGASDISIWIMLLILPPLGAYLVISSMINILRAI